MADLGALIRESRAAFEAAVARLTPEQFLAESDDGWSAKDVLAHVATWEQGTTAMIGGESRPEAMGIVGDPETMDLDSINRQIFEMHRDRPAVEVMAMAREAHARLLAALTTIGDDDLQRPIRDVGGGSGPVQESPLIRSIVSDTYEHYDDHLQSLRDRASGA
jgi:hypothetical protein